jgi:hypothetical protein
LFALFDEYASAYARGERPEAREYLARAGEDGNELARLIDGFLQAAPVPELEPEVVELFEGWLAGDSSLLRLRVARGMTRDRAVEELIDRLDLDRRKWAKVKRYYHQLEAGLLDLDRVDRRVFTALADALHTRASDLFLATTPRRDARGLRAHPRAGGVRPDGSRVSGLKGSRGLRRD